MTPASGRPDHLLWATRGRTWGFRFLLDADSPRPLALYERAVGASPTDPQIVHLVDRLTAVRLTDPLGRKDSSGRLIPHEFVLTGALRHRVRTIDDATTLVWPLVAEVYATVWDATRAPAPNDLIWPGNATESPTTSADHDG